MKPYSVYLEEEDLCPVDVDLDPLPRAYASGWSTSANLMKVVDVNAFSFMSTISLTNTYPKIYVSPDRKKVLVILSGTLYGYERTDVSPYLTLKITAAYHQNGVGFTPDSNYVYIVVGSTISTMCLWKLNLNTWTESNLFPVWLYGGGVLVNPTATKAYVFHTLYQNFAVYDIASGAKLKQVTTGGSVLNTFKKDFSKIFMLKANFGFQVIDTATDTIEASIGGILGTPRLCISPDQSRIYVLAYKNTAPLETHIRVFSANYPYSEYASEKIVLPTAPAPLGISFTSDGAYILYTSNIGYLSRLKMSDYTITNLSSTTIAFSENRFRADPYNP